MYMYQVYCKPILVKCSQMHTRQCYDFDIIGSTSLFEIMISLSESWDRYSADQEYINTVKIRVTVACDICYRFMCMESHPKSLYFGYLYWFGNIIGLVIKKQDKHSSCKNLFNFGACYIRLVLWHVMTDYSYPTIFTAYNWWISR